MTWGRTRICAAVMLLVSVGVGLFAYGDWRSADGLRRRGAPAVAEVVDIAGRREPYFTVRYTTAEGRAVTTRLRDGVAQPEPKVGQYLRVVYDPAHPAGQVADSRVRAYASPWLPTVLAGGSFLSALLVGVILPLRRRR